MDWRDLQIFLTVAEKGQLTKAAAALGMNAKTIARRLRHVETAMGSTLFEQTREGQVLTEAGAALLALTGCVMSFMEAMGHWRETGHCQQRPPL